MIRNTINGLIMIMCFSFAACGKEKVSDIEVNGETVSVTDFLIEHLREYINTEEFSIISLRYLFGYKSSIYDLTPLFISLAKIALFA